MLQYLGNILLLIESLSCDLQDEVNIINDGAARVRDVIQNGRQDGRDLVFGNCKYFLLAVKNDTITHFAAFGCVL